MDIDENQLIEACKKNSSKARNKLYRLYARKLLGICMRYSKNQYEAEDVLHDAFIKIYTKIDQFKGEGLFEAWMKRVVANTAIQHLRDRSKELKTIEINDANCPDIDDGEIELPTLSSGQLMKLIQKLPAGYRLVFNMYVFENMSHSEISEELNISIGTSKSQLSRARQFLKNEISILNRELEKLENVNQLQYE